MRNWVHISSTGRTFFKETSMSQPLPGTTSVVEVDAETYEKIKIGWIFVDGEWTSPPSDLADDCNDPIDIEIALLKENLRATDFMVVEICEYNLAGEEPPHAFSDLYNQRKAWRKAIYELQNKKN